MTVFNSKRLIFSIQKDNCDAARHALNEKLVEFGDDYFYTFGLNQKFCLGIRKFTGDPSRTERQGEIHSLSKHFIGSTKLW